MWVILLLVFAYASVPDAILRTLDGEIQGDVVLSTDANYQRSTKQWNARFDKKSPQAIIFCSNRDDVVTSIQKLRKFNPCVSVRSAGHSFPGYSVMDKCIVLDVSRLNKMNYQSEDKTVILGPGVNFWDFTHFISKYNRTTTHGFGPTVGFGGYTQGGGVGLTHRKFGLAIDNLIRVEIVLQNGTIVNATSSKHSDLFWALQGGGAGNWGAVTEYEFITYDASSPVLYVMIEWKFAKTLVKETNEIWSNYLKNESTSRDFGLYWRINGNPILGEFGTKIQIYGIWTGEVIKGRKVLNSFISLFPNQPKKVTTTEMMIDQAYEKFMGPYRHTPHTGFFLRSRLLKAPLEGNSLDSLASQLDKLHVLQTFALVWMDPLGGKVAEVQPEDTAFYWRDSFANFAVFVFYLTENAKDSAQSWMSDTFEKLELKDESVYINFNYNMSNYESAFYGGNYDRLQSIKASVDPDNFWNFPQSVKPKMEWENIGGSGQCIAKNCLTQGKDCFLDKNCRTTLFCIARCGTKNQTCTYGCELDYADALFDNMFTCMVTHECIPHYPPDPFTPPTSLETGFFIDTMAGKGNWWIVRGFSPAYDKFPCQRLNFNHSKNGWVYTANFEYEPSKYATLKANITAQGKGVFLLEYTEHGLHHVETWYLIAATLEKSVGYESRVFRYAGKTPIMDYDGGIWFQYTKDYNPSKEGLDYITKRLSANSIDVNSWSHTDNSGCTNLN